MPTEDEIKGVSSLSELNQLVCLCERCPLGKLKTRDVPGVGSEKAEVMFIGEAPGKEEDLKGEPFVGAAGKFLNEMLAEIELSRSDVYIANVLKHRPPANRDPLPNEVEACWPYLKRQLEIINPSLVIFLGRHAMQRFFPSHIISKVHGKVFKAEFNGKNQNFLALYHPAAALYNGGMRDVLKEDFRQIPKILKDIKKEGGQDLKQEKLF